MPQPPLQFVYDLPHISQRKLALIKLVAQYAILDPSALEKFRHQFEFMEPENDLYELYSSFLRQYRLVVDGHTPNDSRSLIKRAIDRANELADRSAQSANHTSQRSSGSSLPVDQSLDKHVKNSLSSYDWQDFVVLETIEFNQADFNGTSVLHPPLTKDEIQLEKLSAHPANDVLVQSEITGEMIPLSKYNEHVKLHNIDPSYFDQKDKELKRSESNLDYDNAADRLRLLEQKRKKLSESLDQ